MTASLVSLFAGLFLGTVGTEPQYGVERFTFGVPFLRTEVGFVTVLIGLFAIGEVLDQLATRRAGAGARGRAPRGAAAPAARPLAAPVAAAARHRGGDRRRRGSPAPAPPSRRSSLRARATGLPDPELFGTGHADGLVASESSVNGSTGGAMIHLLARHPGERGDRGHDGRLPPARAPAGALLFVKQPEAVYTIFAGMILANVLMIGLGYLAALTFATVMKVPPPILNTFIVVFCVIGAFALRNDLADVWLTVLFGVLGFVMRRHGLPVPALVMGVILGRWPSSTSSPAWSPTGTTGRSS